MHDSVLLMAIITFDGVILSGSPIDRYLSHVSRVRVLRKIYNMLTRGLQSTSEMAYP